MTATVYISSLDTVNMACLGDGRAVIIVSGDVYLWARYLPDSPSFTIIPTTSSLTTDVGANGGDIAIVYGSSGLAYNFIWSTGTWENVDKSKTNLQRICVGDNG